MGGHPISEEEALAVEAEAAPDDVLTPAQALAAVKQAVRSALPVVTLDAILSACETVAHEADWDGA